MVQVEKVGREVRGTGGERGGDGGGEEEMIREEGEKELQRMTKDFQTRHIYLYETVTWGFVTKVSDVRKTDGGGGGGERDDGGEGGGSGEVGGAEGDGGGGGGGEGERSATLIGSGDARLTND